MPEVTMSNMSYLNSFVKDKKDSRNGFSIDNKKVRDALKTLSEKDIIVTHIERKITNINDQFEECELSLKFFEPFEVSDE